jgi:antitoxin (DNA-binding transcriptional repressor) of toxin-antitoxin stability system
MQVNIYDAKTRLSAMLDLASSGKEVVTVRAGKPMARLVPLLEKASKSGVRLGGLKHLRAKVAADFHAPVSTFGTRRS